MSKQWKCEMCGKIFTQKEMEELEWHDGRLCDRPVEADMLCGGLVVLKEALDIGYMNKEQVVDFAQCNEEVIEILGDLVADYKSIEATNINNEGPNAQIEYLIESGMTVDDIKNELMEEIE